MIRRSLSFLLLAILAAGSGFAETTAVQERSALSTSPASMAHANAESQTRFSREQWGLDETEWQRYQTLMTGIRGSISPASLSPIEVLGIHARDEAERKRYAKRLAELMKEDADRVLAFQAAYSEAFAELYPGGLLIDPSRLPLQSPRQSQLQIGDRLLLFVTLQNCPRCEDQLHSALDGQRAGAQLDIYVTGGQVKDDDIRAWARTHRIDPEAVKAKRLTLNHERGELARLAGPGASAPKLVRIRHGETTLLK